MKSIVFTAPALLCAIIVFPALLDSARKPHADWHQALLCAFLPGCFLLLAGVLIRMNRDISRLRRRLARLEGKAGSAPHSSSGSPAEGAASFKTEGGAPERSEQGSRFTP
jgi:hypothetical protein